MVTPLNILPKGIAHPTLRTSDGVTLSIRKPKYQTSGANRITRLKLDLRYLMLIFEPLSSYGSSVI